MSDRDDEDTVSDHEGHDRHPAPSDAVRLRRRPDRGSHDPAVVAAILDAADLVHVAFATAGRPMSIPLLHARQGDRLLLHVAGGGRLARALTDHDIAVSAAVVDGLVLARSAFHHSMNYRSVVVMGRAERITDTAARRSALDAFVDRVVPGRRAHLRPMTDTEVAATAVLALSLTESSAKVRAGGPVDDDADIDWPVWAGVIPVRRTLGAPEPAGDLADGFEVPDHVRALDAASNLDASAGASA